MKGILLLLLLFSASILSHSQDLPHFGKPILQELEMKECSFDKHANALKLIDYQEKEIIVDYGLKIKTERRVKIKIFNEKGFKSANISIPYISRIKGTKITDITAYIHYIDSTGKIVTEKVGKKQIFRDKEDDAVKKIKFTFPSVKAGCVIEYKYEKTEKNSLHLEPWFFQDFIPTNYSCFKLTAPTLVSMDINRRIVGVDTINEKSKRENPRYGLSITEKTYSLTNIHAFKPEPMMTSVADNLQRIEFAIKPSGLGFAGIFGNADDQWARIAVALNETSFGKQFSRAIPGTETLLDSVKKLPSREEKIHYIFQRVKQHMKWDEMQTFYADNIADAWKEKSGNSAEINLLILNLLRKAGIPCTPLLISTRENGRIDEKFVTLSQFNGVDVLIVDSTGSYILDGTRKYQSYQTPPENIMNRQAFSADITNTGWVFISDSRPLLKIMLNVSANLSEDGKLTGDVLMTFYDHSKSQRLSEKNKTEEEEEEEKKEFLQKDFSELKIDSLVLENENDELKPLSEKFKFTYQLTSTGNFLFLDPFFLSNFRKNPFSDSIRRTSIDFNSRQYLTTNINILLPENYEIDHLPKSLRLRMADSSILFQRSIYQNEQQLFFKSTMEVLYPLFDKEEYPGVRDFFSRMYGMVAEQIILKKK